MPNNAYPYKGPIQAPANSHETVLKLTGVGGEACLDDWIAGKPFNRWDLAYGIVTKRDAELLKCGGFVYVELWKTKPLVQRVCRIRL